MQYSDYGFKFGNADEAAATKGEEKRKKKEKQDIDTVSASTMIVSYH